MNVVTGVAMTEYMVMFYTKVSAKSDEQLQKKAEQISESMSKCLKKKVEAHGFVEIVKKDTPTTNQSVLI